MSERARRANSTHLILTVRGAAGTPAALFGKRNNGMSGVREDWQYPGTLPQKYKWICFCKPLVTISLPVLRGLSCHLVPFIRSSSLLSSGLRPRCSDHVHLLQRFVKGPADRWL